MVADTLVDRKVETSERLVGEMLALGAPLLAAYWAIAVRTKVVADSLLPKSANDERQLVNKLRRS